jgi:enterochelin esterase-like enzyme
MRRRELLLGVSALALGCSRRDRAPEVTTPPVASPASPLPAAPADAAMPRGRTKLLTWTFDERGPAGQAVVLVPDWGGPDARFPVLIALHGRGEAIKAPAEGAMGWPRDYALTRAIERVCAPPITEQDLEGFVEDDQVATINHRLEERPFGGLIVVCPYLPDLNLRSSVDAADYARFLVGSVLPRVRRETPALATPEATGIDGVSLGGATALRVGLTNTDAFGAVGALQPAITDDQSREWTELARAALAKRPSLKLRLTTSHDDYFRVAINRLSAAMRAANVAHDFADLPGPHDYPFNRGPGAIEMLLWHDRVLARA